MLPVQMHRAPPPTGGAPSPVQQRQLQHFKAAGDPPPAAGGGGGCGGREVVAVAAAVDVCLAAAAMAGAALLAWWALAFRPSCARLWMVPVGLVLAGTPAVVCAALHLSPSSTPAGGGGKDVAGATTAPLCAVVVDK